MTRDDSSRRIEAQRVADALGDLFDGVAPSNRAAAEEELRDAGIDPNRIAQRIAATAVAALAESDAGRRGVQRQVSRAGQRGASREPDPRRSPRARAFVRVAAVLLVGIAIGWIVARGSAPTPEPQVQVARNLSKPASERQQAAVAERASNRVDSPKTSASAAGAPPQIDAPSEAAGAAAAAAAAAPAAAPQTVDRQEESKGQALAPSHPQDGAVAEGEEDDETEGADALAAGGSDEPWVLEQSNWKRGKDLLPPPVLQHVQTGDYWFTVHPTAGQVFARSYSQRFWTQTLANTGAYAVDPSNCSLQEVGGSSAPAFFFGLPFPGVGRDDPSAACEIMWNVTSASGIAGGQEAPVQLDQFAAGARAIDRRLQLQLVSTMFLGRHSGPLYNPYALRSASLAQVKSPSDLAGHAFLTRRPNDPLEHDKIWAYIPALRRVRSVPPASRSDGLHGTDLSLDELDCFDGKLEDFNWKVVGSQTVLAPMTSLSPATQDAVSATRTQVEVPMQRAVVEVEGAHGAPWLTVDNLVMAPRSVWVVEGVPRDKNYLFGKLVLYVDQELYRTYWRLAFSWTGEYKAHTMCAQHWSRSADDGLETSTVSALTAGNDAMNRATLARSRNQSFDQARDAEFFTIPRVIKSSH